MHPVSGMRQSGQGGVFMSRWFRFHSDAIRNPKVAALSDKEFRLWVELLSVASANDGHIPPLGDLKHVLRRRLDHLSTGVKRLISALLIDVLEDGYEPHGWGKYQYKSDTSTERVNKFREKRNVSETPPEQNRTEQIEEYIEAKASCASDDALAPDHFVESWNALAVRIGRPTVRKVTPERRTRLRARIKGFTLDEFIEVLNNVERSPFLRGDKAWSGCTFDWITKKENFLKTLEGNYNG
jgi:hypothetical protein